MKSISKLFVVASAAAFFCGASASAQEWVGVNRDDNGNIVRGAYLTNEWYDNWYIVLLGGATTALSSVNDPVITPQFEISIAKWFTPSVGTRLGYQGFSGKEALTVPYNPYQMNHSPLPFDGANGTTGTLSYGQAYIHGDLLFSLSNAIWGYRYDRFFNSSIYANAGIVRMYDNSEGQGFSSENHDNEFAFGAGLYNTFRITERLTGVLDLRHYSTASRYKTLDGVRTHHPVVLAGLSYNIYRTYWNRAQGIIGENATAKADALAARQALDKANDEIAALEQRVKDKEAEIAAKEAELASRPATIPAGDNASGKDSASDAAGKDASGKGTGSNASSDRPVVLDNSKEVVEIPYDELRSRAEKADLTLYYYINVDKLNFSELRHLDEYVQRVLNEDPEHVFYLTGSADKGTGSLERNTVLCRSRAYGVRDILVKDYGVKDSNVIIKATVISDRHIDGAYDRCVIIESK